MRSMTGYGSAEIQTPNFHIKVEIKSLNGKFLEVNLRSPKMLGEKEIELRRHLSNVLDRGSVLCTISLDRPQDAEFEVSLNGKLAAAYYREMKSLADELGAPDQDIFRTVMTMPEILKTEETGVSPDDWKQILSCCNTALGQLDEYRKQEGRELSQLLKSHNDEILRLLPLIDPLEAVRKQGLKDKLRSGLDDLNKEVGVEENRLEQEMIYYLEKLDISEEKNRLLAHCQMFDKELLQGGNGKKLGFISQEMGREINTLGSKANHAAIQEIVIGMKEELEKIKEQTLNVL